MAQQRRPHRPTGRDTRDLREPTKTPRTKSLAITKLEPKGHVPDELVVRWRLGAELDSAAQESLDEKLQKMQSLFGVEVQQMQVAEAREALPGLIRDVTGENRVVVVRNGRRPTEEGVVIMSEARALGATSRGGMNLAQLVASFRDRPVKVRSLTVDDRPETDSEGLTISARAAQASAAR